MERFSNWDRREDCAIHKSLKKVLFLECGSKPQDATFQIDENGNVVSDQFFVLDRLFIDTKKLCKPLVKLEFSSLVSFDATDTEVPLAITANLLFSLIKVCDGEKEVLQTWEYVNSIAITDAALGFTVTSSEPFTVTFCDKPYPCDKNSGCCEYRMVVKGVAFDGTFTSLRVTKPDLSAIVQGIIEA